MNDKYNNLIAAATAVVDNYNMQRNTLIVVESYNTKMKAQIDASIEELTHALDELKVDETDVKKYNDIAHMMHITGLSYQDSVEALAIITTAQHDDF